MYVIQRGGGGPMVVVSAARVRGSFSGLGGLKETKMFLPHPLQPPSQGHTSTARWPCYSALRISSVIAAF